MPGISKMKNIIIVTGGAGFIGSNLIKNLLKKTNKKIISLDNYSSGSKKNHSKNSRVKYIKLHTVDISNHLKNNSIKQKNISTTIITIILFSLIVSIFYVLISNEIENRKSFINK